MSWTDERIQQLKDLWSQGLSASEIADILGDITRNAVIGKAHRLGLSGRPSPIKKKPTRGATIHQDFHFCGKTALPGMPYCAEHAALAYQPASGSKKRDEERNVGAA